MCEDANIKTKLLGRQTDKNTHTHTDSDTDTHQHVLANNKTAFQWNTKTIRTPTWRKRPGRFAHAGEWH